MSNRELVQQLNGALMNSMGQDFEIRADFVREIIAALSARSETAPIHEYDNSVPPIYETLAAIVATVPNMPEPQSETQAKRFAAQGATPVDVLCAQLEFVCSPIHTIHEERKETCDKVTTKLRTLEREFEAHGRIEDQLETGIEDLKHELAEAKQDTERAFQMLAVYGVPRERAKYVATGIDVLATRMSKENSYLKHDIERAVQNNTGLLQQLSAARASERERCAKVCRLSGWTPSRNECAAAILALTDEENGHG